MIFSDISQARALSIFIQHYRSFEAIKQIRDDEDHHVLNLPEGNKTLLSHLSVMLGVPMPTIYELMKKSRCLVSVSVDILTFDEPTRHSVMLLLKLRKTRTISENSEMQAAQDKS